MPQLGAPEIIILLVVVVLLFGATRLPKAAEGIGKALKIFKREVGSKDEAVDATTAQAAANPPAVSQTPQATANGTVPQAAAPTVQNAEQPKQ